MRMAVSVWCSLGGRKVVMPVSLCRCTYFKIRSSFANPNAQEDRFYQRYPCIVITAKGQPDVASRMFLSRITYELQIPVLALVDSDPYGLKILSVYMSGSKNMSYDSASLTTPDIKWLGLRPSDLNKWEHYGEWCVHRDSQLDDTVMIYVSLTFTFFISPRKVWSPGAMPSQNDGERYQDGQGAAPGSIHHEKSRMDEGASEDGKSPFIIMWMLQVITLWNLLVFKICSRTEWRLTYKNHRSRQRKRPKSRRSRPSAFNMSLRNISLESE